MTQFRQFSPFVFTPALNTEQGNAKTCLQKGCQEKIDGNEVAKRKALGTSLPREKPWERACHSTQLNYAIIIKFLFVHFAISLFMFVCGW